MSEECLGKLCIVCGKTIQGANYHCTKCKACICFYCGADVLKQVEADKLRCPRCGAELE
jgi:DNA-directed RNA polymerase subunit RPC12/RpoP